LDALQLMKDDHATVRKLLDQLEQTTERGVKTREELFTRIKKELTVHETIEEEIFYPALRAHPRAKELVLEAYEEHDVVDRLLGELGSTPFDDETWGPKAKVMQENLEHHIEEEEGEMFQKARQAFSRDELRDLGERMTERKRSAQQTG
jgi:hemerythrin-like domain-containing protein